MRRREFVAVLSGAAIAWPVRARAVGLAAFVFFGAFDSTTAREPQCTCRAFGRSFELGQTACLQTPKGPRMAVCVMVLNMTSWQIWV